MLTRLVLAFGMGVIALGTAALSAAPPVLNPGNGHYYERIEAPAITWDDARQAASISAFCGVQGHLATLATQQENDFILQQGADWGYHWLGGYQAPGSIEPDQGWAWVTGEAWNYTRWVLPNEPNNFGGNEDALEWRSQQEYAPGGWNDRCRACSQISYVAGYIVEYDLPVGVVFNFTNGHFYERIDAQGITWDDANSQAQGRSFLGTAGHLATLATQQENDFILQQGADWGYHWLGGYQAPGSIEPDQGWAWVTGEPWNYTRWVVPNEPNNFGGNEDALEWRSQQEYAPGGWNDRCRACGQISYIAGYIVEYDASITDTDNDGWPDTCDNCPSIANPDQSDTDHDGIGNVCDNCPTMTNGTQIDSDNDGVGDVCDNCPTVPNGAAQAADPLIGNQNDLDGDGIGDACDDDIDGDGVSNNLDACPRNRTGLPVDCHGRPLRDCNGDCRVDGLDAQCIVNELLGN